MGSAKKQTKSYRARATRSSGRANLLTSDPLQNTAQLNDQLRSLGLYAAPTLGDGNCLFRALSDQYYGSPSRHADVRRDICDFIEAHPERYEGFVDIDEFGDSGVRKGKGGGLSAYVAGMRQNATYGGHMELSAFAHLTRRNIKVIQPGLVYVIQWDPQQPKSPKVKSKSPPDSPSKHTRLGSKKILDGDGDTPMPLQEEHEEDEGGPTIYVAYHDWEHFSSVRSLRGPHSGIPNVHETPPPPTSESSTSASSSASSPPDEHLSAAKARKKERERKEKEKKEAGRVKAKEKATAGRPSSSSALPRDKPKSKIKDEQKSASESTLSSSVKSSSIGSGFKLRIPARPSMTTPTLSMTAPTPISAGASPLSSLSPSPAPSQGAVGDVDVAVAVPLPASAPPSVATSPPVSHSPSPAPGAGVQSLSGASDAPMASPNAEPTSSGLIPASTGTAPNPYTTYPFTYAPYGPLQYPPYPYNYTTYPYTYPAHPSQFSQATSAPVNGVYAYPSSMSQPPGQASTSTSNLGYYHPPQHPHVQPASSSGLIPASAPLDASSQAPYSSLTCANSTIVAIDPLSRLTHLTHLNPPPRSQRSPKRSFEESINEEGSVESGVSASSGDSKRSRIDETQEVTTPQNRGRHGHRSAEVEISPEDVDTDTDADAEGDPDPDVLPDLSTGNNEPEDADRDAEGDIDEDATEEREVEEDLSPPRTTPGLSPDTGGSSSSLSESLEELDEADDYGDDYVDDDDEDEDDEDEDRLEPNLNHTRPVSASIKAKSTLKSRRAVSSTSALGERPLTRRERKKLGLPKTRAASGKIAVPAGRTTRSATRRGADSVGEWNSNGSGRVDVRGFRELKI